MEDVLVNECPWEVSISDYEERCQLEAGHTGKHRSTFDCYQNIPPWASATQEMAVVTVEWERKGAAT